MNWPGAWIGGKLVKKCPCPSLRPTQILLLSPLSAEAHVTELRKTPSSTETSTFSSLVNCSQKSKEKQQQRNKTKENLFPSLTTPF